MAGQVLRKDSQNISVMDSHKIFDAGGIDVMHPLPDWRELRLEAPLTD